MHSKGVEPSIPYGRRILNPERMPVPPRVHINNKLFATSFLNLPSDDTYTAVRFRFLELLIVYKLGWRDSNPRNTRVKVSDLKPLGDSPLKTTY